jgi:hypothetical protein
VSIFAVPAILAQELKSDLSTTVPGVQVLLRLDRNRDGFLDDSEVPWEVQAFVDANVAKYQAPVSDQAKSDCIRNANGLNLELLVERAESFQQESAEDLPASNPVIDLKMTRTYAATMLAVHDTDRDGFLNRQEAESLADDGRRVDFDSDGKITISELEVQFQIGWDKGLIRGTSNLPSDFSDLDRNQNSQIEMHEYSTNWTDEILHTFFTRDYNMDGVIESKEWLRYQVDNLKKPEKDQTESKHD